MEGDADGAVGKFAGELLVGLDGSGSLMIYVFLVYPFLWFLFHPPAKDQTVDESLMNTPVNSSLSHSHST